MELLLPLYLIYAVACAAYTRHLMAAKGYATVWWTIGAVAFGMLTLLTAVGMPRRPDQVPPKTKRDKQYDML